MNFLIAGHTKFTCDLCFGLIKKKYRRTRVSNLNELAEVNINFYYAILFKFKAWTLEWLMWSLSSPQDSHWLETNHLLLSTIFSYSTCKHTWTLVDVHGALQLQVVSKSSKVNTSQLVTDQDGTVIVKCYDWAKFFSSAKKIPGIKKLHQFRFTSDKPGNNQVIPLLVESVKSWIR